MSRFTIRRIQQLLVASVVATASLIVPLGASAQVGASLPVLLPNPLPAGYVFTEAEDATIPGFAQNYVYLATDGASVLSGQPQTGVRSVLISANPATGSERELIKASRAGTKTKVGKNPAVAILDDGIGSLLWVDGKTAFTVQHVAPKVTLAGIRAIGVSVKPSRLADSSFSLTKKVPGVTTRYKGPLSALLGRNTWEAIIESETNDAITISGIEADPLYLDYAIAATASLRLVSENSVKVSTTTVRGRPGVFFGTTLIWQEAPGVLMSVDSEDVSESTVSAVAETLQPVDAAGWEATKKLVAERVAVPTPDPLNPAADLQAAGMIDQSPWKVVAVPGSVPKEVCYSFTIAELSVPVCPTPEVLAGGVVWKAGTVADRRTVFGIATAKAATVVLRDAAGVELMRSATVALTSKAGSAFVFQVGSPGVLTPVADGAATLQALDAAGAPIGTPVPVTR
jgi:hypothetical protein